MERSNRQMHHEKMLYWYLTSRCNLKCSYCDIHRLESKQETQFVSANMDAFLNGLKSLYGTWEVFIGGGEPFVFPGFLQLIEKLAMMGHFISVVTNFTASQKTYLKFLEVASDRINLCVASYKPDVHEFNTYLKKALIINKTINKQKGQFAIGAVATEKDIDFLFKTGKRFKEHGITFRLQVEKVNGRYRKYIKKDIDKILYFGRSYGLEGTTDFHDRLCLSGKNYFVLTPYGHAFRCHSDIAPKKWTHS